MYEIIDKILLFLGCTAFYLFRTDSNLAIIPILITLALGCFFIYFEDGRVRLVGSLLFAAICFFQPEYIVFLPFVLYDVLLNRNQWVVATLPILLLVHMPEYSSATVLVSVGFTTAAYILRFKTDRLNKLQMDYYELRDVSTHISLELEAKNKDLLANQDAQINLATLNERNRISKEIHDNIGHLLSRSLLQIGAMLIIAKEEPIRDGLSSLKESISQGMDQIRNSIHHMYDESIDLYQQLDRLVKDFTACHISYEYDIKNPPPLPIKHSLIAIVKESLANVMRHSNATRVSILLREHPAIYQLIIQDNGTLSKQQQKSLTEMIERQDFGSSMGLRNIFERVKGFDGNINLSFDQGFKLFITIPKTTANN
ncbi:MAG: sensor histidine kinase [Clostridiales bacterium]|nr:sensor histidine kinase [Clostridiales bacterium]